MPGEVDSGVPRYGRRPDVLFRAWNDCETAVAYVGSSARTHLLDASAAVLMASIPPDPVMISPSELATSLGVDAAAEPEFLAKVVHTLDELSRLGLLHRSA